MGRYTFPHAGDTELSDAYNKAREAAKVAPEFTEVSDDLGDPDDEFEFEDE